MYTIITQRNIYGKKKIIEIDAMNLAISNTQLLFSDALINHTESLLISLLFR